MICEELMSDGFKPLTVIPMTLRSDYSGVAAAGGGRITGSVKYFKDHPNDVGAMVHETVHCVQLYRGRGNPGWLVEGVADYSASSSTRAAGSGFDSRQSGRSTTAATAYRGIPRVT